MRFVAEYQEIQSPFKKGSFEFEAVSFVHATGIAKGRCVKSRLHYVGIKPASAVGRGPDFREALENSPEPAPILFHCEPSDYNGLIDYALSIRDFEWVRHLDRRRRELAALKKHSKK